MEDYQPNSFIENEDGQFGQISELEKAVWRIVQDNVGEERSFENGQFSIQDISPMNRKKLKNDQDCMLQYINVQPIDDLDNSAFDHTLNETSEFYSKAEISDMSQQDKDAIFKIHQGWLAYQAQDRNLQSITPQSSQVESNCSYSSYSPQRNPSLYEFQETLYNELDWGSTIKQNNCTREQIHGYSNSIQENYSIFNISMKQDNSFLPRQMTEFGVSPILSRKESAFLQPFFSRQNTTDSNFLDCNQFDILMLTREYSTSADEAKTTPLKQFSVSDFSLYQIPNERSEYNETIWEEDSYSIASEGEEIQNPKRKIIEYGASGGLLTRIR